MAMVCLSVKVRFRPPLDLEGPATGHLWEGTALPTGCLREGTALPTGRLKEGTPVVVEGSLNCGRLPSHFMIPE